MLENLLEMDLPLLTLFLRFSAASGIGHCRRQGMLAMILYKLFHAFITPGVELHSSPASPSNSTPKLTQLAEQVDHALKSASYLFQW